MAELTNEGMADFISQELFLAEAFLIIGLFVVIRSQKRGIMRLPSSQKATHTFGVVFFGFGAEQHRVWL